MPPKKKKGQQYIAVESFVANIDGLDKAFHANRTRVYEDDPILARTPEDWWILVEDFDQDAA